MVTYADECTLMVSDPVVYDVCLRLNVYLTELASYFYKNINSYNLFHMN